MPKKTPQNRLSEAKLIENKSTSEAVEFYAIPLASLALFVILIIFLLIPQVTDLTKKISDLDKAKKTVQKKEAEIAALNNLKNDVDTINSQIDYLDIIIPTSKTQIVSYEQQIEDIAKSSNLKITAIETGENLIKVTSSSSTGTSAAVSLSTFSANSSNITAVPTEIVYNSLRIAPTKAVLEGKFADIKSFLSNFYKTKSLLIINTLDLSQDITKKEDIWTLSVTFARYVFAEDFADKNNSVFGQVDPTVRIDSKFIDYLHNRFSASSASSSGSSSSSTSSASSSTSSQ